MSFCENLPPCRRMSCTMAACEHLPHKPHPITGICEAYVYPENWGVCMNCGKLSTEHDEAEPHALGMQCEGFEYAPGITASTFIGGGGSFGGGGASGSW